MLLKLLYFFFMSTKLPVFGANFQILLIGFRENADVRRMPSMYKFEIVC